MKSLNVVKAGRALAVPGIIGGVSLAACIYNEPTVDWRPNESCNFEPEWDWDGNYYETYVNLIEGPLQCTGVAIGWNPNTEQMEEQHGVAGTFQTGLVIEYDFYACDFIYEVSTRAWQTTDDGHYGEVLVDD